MTSKHTPAPWKAVINGVGYWEVVHPWPEQSFEEANHYSPTVVHVCTKEGDEHEANARLISAAPELLEELKKRTENEEQRVFEDWLDSKRPSGDADEVNRQWLASSDYADFCDEWSVELDSISKATGEAQ